MSCAQILKAEKEKEKEKEKVRGQGTREKDIERERKNKGDIFCWRNNMKFCSGGEKMRNATGYLGENKRHLDSE